MLTKCIVIGSPKLPVKVLKPIELTHTITCNGSCKEAPESFAGSFNFLELICTNYTYGIDLIFGYNSPEHRGSGVLYMGKWNDGVAE